MVIIILALLPMVWFLNVCCVNWLLRSCSHNYYEYFLHCYSYVFPALLQSCHHDNYQIYQNILYNYNVICSAHILSISVPKKILSRTFIQITLYPSLLRQGHRIWQKLSHIVFYVYLNKGKGNLIQINKFCFTKYQT